ncbi:MAG: apolipoprotein N-acyltransferase [Bradymonadia bacterium]|jgi:apolipoprotein N-acyltransferase
MITAMSTAPVSIDDWARDLSVSARWALAVLAGVLNGVAFVFWGPAALIANVPLLIALRGGGRAWLYAGLAGIVGVLAGAHIYGILEYGVALLIAFSLYTGSQMVVFGLLYRRLYGRMLPGRWGRVADVALPALIWTLTEWIRTVGPLAMPASYVGCIADVAALRPWLHLAPLLGGLGVSTCVALGQSAIYHALFRRQTHGFAALGAVGLLLAAGVVGYIATPALGERPIRVVGVQGGLANTQYKAALVDPRVAADIKRTYATLSQRAYAQSPDLVVWPETALRAPVLDDPAALAHVSPPPDSNITLAAGLLHRADGQIYNRVAAIHHGAVIGHYDKVRRVPRTEDYITPGAERRPIVTPAGRIGVFICLESVYPQAAREVVANGAQMLIVPTNDAGFGHSPISKHMTQRAIVRAVATGRWLLRVGQAGITTLIDPRGEMHGQLSLFEPQILTGTARLRSDATLFVRWGDWWMAVCGGLLALLSLMALRRSPADAPPIAG